MAGTSYSTVREGTVAIQAGFAASTSFLVTSRSSLTNPAGVSVSRLLRTAALASAALARSMAERLE